MNENGPISSIQVAVVFVDSELSQKFDETLLKGYKEAMDDGTSYYIAAELPNEVLFFCNMRFLNVGVIFNTIQFSHKRSSHKGIFIPWIKKN